MCGQSAGSLYQVLLGEERESSLHATKLLLSLLASGVWDRIPVFLRRAKSRQL